MRGNWDDPVMVKGIQTIEDAHASMNAYLDGITMAANHGTFSRSLGEREGALLPGISCGECHLSAGGRQVDGAIGSFNILEAILSSWRDCTPRNKASSSSVSSRVSFFGT
jgi:isopentenyl diphosphate isomerase/L-lactate dehydrogenase-like FMN-dependent dehydrogenase